MKLKYWNWNRIVLYWIGLDWSNGLNWIGLGWLVLCCNDMAWLVLYYIGLDRVHVQDFVCMSKPLHAMRDIGFSILPGGPFQQQSVRTTNENMFFHHGSESIYKGLQHMLRRDRK